MLNLHRNGLTQMFKYFTFPLLLILSFPTYALSSDSKLPMNISSDTVDFNSKTGITIFTGDVNMDQGTTHLKADKVTVYRHPDGEIQKIIAIGLPAHYRTLPKENDDTMDAYGNTIEYYPDKEQAVILGNGLVQQGKNTFTSPHIIYDLAKETVISRSTSSGGKSQLILQPKRTSGQKTNL